MCFNVNLSIRHLGQSGSVEESPPSPDLNIPDHSLINLVKVNSCLFKSLHTLGFGRNSLNHNEQFNH